ncbi:MAG: Na+/H+ antiporter subunit E [Pseudomonadota bacterium]
MNVFAINLILAALWCAFVGGFSAGQFGAGFLLGFLTLWAARPLFPEDGYFLRVPRLIRLAGLFLYELFVSSFKVAADVLSLRPGNRPGIVAVPIRTQTETGTLLLSSLVSLTPGSLSLDLSEDGDVLYVHAMFVDDPDAFRAEVRDGLEQPVLEALE